MITLPTVVTTTIARTVGSTVLMTSLVTTVSGPSLSSKRKNQLKLYATISTVVHLSAFMGQTRTNVSVKVSFQISVKNSVAKFTFSC